MTNEIKANIFKYFHQIKDINMTRTTLLVLVKNRASRDKSDLFQLFINLLE